MSNENFDKTLQEKLVEGYEVWIYSSSLAAIQATAGNSRQVLYRSLLKYFLGEELAHLSYKKLPQDIRDASLGNLNISYNSFSKSTSMLMFYYFSLTLAHANMNAVIPMKGCLSKITSNVCSSVKRTMTKNKKGESKDDASDSNENGQSPIYTHKQHQVYIKLKDNYTDDKSES